MKENDRLDQWLRKSLENYRPAAGNSARDRFLADAEITYTTGTNGRYYNILSLVLLLAVSGLLNWQTDSSTKVKASKPQTTQLTITKTTGKNITDAGSETATADKIERSEKKLSAGNSTSGTVTSKPVASKVSAEKKSNQPDSYAEPFACNPITTDLTTESETITTVTETIPVTVMNELPANLTLPDVQNTDAGIKPDQDPVKNKEYNKFYNQSLSLFYRPEILWNVIDNEKLAHNFGLDWNTRLFNGNYLLGTGFGFSMTKGYYEYAVEYNEFLGNFTRLDSVTFNWNPRQFTMQQTVHTTEEEVFDTAVTTDYARVYRKFAYLQLPLTLGYDVINTKNTTLGLRFVPVLSVLMSKKPVNFRYETGQNKLVQINRITPDRVKTNWQLNAGLCYGRRLTESLWLEFEPRVTYYFNSVYEKSDNSSSPMGASIRVAVGIKY